MPTAHQSRVRPTKTLPTLWGIGMGEWVEIRESKEEPTRVSSSFSCPSEEDSMEWNPDTATYRRVKRKKEVPVEVVIWEGGKVLKVITLNSFYRLAGHAVRKGKLIQIPPDRVPKVLGLKLLKRAAPKKKKAEV